jgi:transposase
LLVWRGLARQRFDIKAEFLHVDTTSFSVSGEYGSREQNDAVSISSTEEGKPISIETGEQNDAVPIETGEQSGSVPMGSKEEEGPVPIAITYGYSRDHREDLKQWMLALATTHDGEVPIFLRPLDGNSESPKSISQQRSKT